MNKGKHSQKKASSNKKRNKNINSSIEDIYSNSARVKNKKPASNSWRAFDVILRILLFIECAILLGCIIYVGTMQLLPSRYIIIITLVVAFICGLQTFLRYFRKKRPLMRSISLVLTVVTMLTTYYGAFMIGSVYYGIGDMTSGEHEVDPKIANVTKEPFIIYVSGSDARDVSEIKEKGLSDVNMIIAVDPTEHKMLMINTPRDYYVPLYGGDVTTEGGEGELDKLTHAGTYGIDCSMKTLEMLYDIEFNYYVRINFKSVVELVDAVGGITVDSEYAFSSGYGLKDKTYYFTKGENELDGDAALAFARERKSLAGGDRQRGKNQQLVISAIVDKAVSPAILNLNNFKSLLLAVTSNTKMNISADEIKALFQMQLDDMAKWDIESVSVDGTGAYDYTYTYPRQSLWVMNPDYDTIEEAKTALTEFME